MAGEGQTQEGRSLLRSLLLGSLLLSGGTWYAALVIIFKNTFYVEDIEVIKLYHFFSNLLKVLKRLSSTEMSHPFKLEFLVTGYLKPGEQESADLRQRWSPSHQQGANPIKPRNTKGGKYHYTVDLLFDWFVLVCFANKNKICQLSYS
jgi:hypothetical protein